MFIDKSSALKSNLDAGTIYFQFTPFEFIFDT